MKVKNGILKGKYEVKDVNPKGCVFLYGIRLKHMQIYIISSIINIYCFRRSDL